MAALTFLSDLSSAWVNKSELIDLILSEPSVFMCVSMYVVCIYAFVSICYYVGQSFIMLSIVHYKYV